MYYSASYKFSILYFKTQYDTVILGAFQFDFEKKTRMQGIHVLCPVRPP